VIVVVLSERKIRILEAIINDYIQTAEPIGSRTIAKKYDMGISSATIRNEMSDLEEMGLIVQPYSSSGRVPSDRGYRLYVDNLMRQRDLTPDEASYLRKIIAANINQVDLLMQETARAVAMLTNCATVVSEAPEKLSRIKHVSLIPTDGRSFLLLLVTDTNAVKNQMVFVDESLDEAALSALSEILNSSLKNMTLSDIDKDAAEKITIRFNNNVPIDKNSKGRGGSELRASRDFDGNGLNQHDGVIIAALNAVVQIMRQEDEVQVYTSGMRNILNFPEFSNVNKARAMIQALEEKDMLITLLGNDNSDSVQVVIGSENHMALLEDCSVIKANYQVGNRNWGSIGVIGPKRMNYSQAVSVLGGILKHINAVIEALTGG
jgi:heat-inducible transcriptional repressor